MKEEVSLFPSFTPGLWDVHPRPALISTQVGGLSLTPFSVQPLPPLQNKTTLLCSCPQPSLHLSGSLGKRGMRQKKT